MTTFPLLLLCSFGLIAGLRGARHLATKEELQDAHATSHTITHILLSSMLVAAALTTSLLAPLLLEPLIGLFAHTHPPQSDMLHHVVAYLSTPLALLFGFSLLGAYLLWAWGRLIWQWWRIQRSLRMLQALQVDDAFDASSLWQRHIGMTDTFGGPILLVPGAWSVLVGVHRPKLLLGVELLSVLTPQELEALLAHEEAHRQRQDPLYRLLLLFCSRLLPYIGHPLFAQWSESVEKICDQAAASQVKDPLLVATALIRTQRLQLQTLSSLANTSDHTVYPNAIGFTQQSCVEVRVRRLLALDLAHSLPEPPKLGHFLTSKMAIFILLLPYPLHHSLEYLFSLLS